jgi:glycosyltransferase involved in cell wall biosynthesis
LLFRAQTGENMSEFALDQQEGRLVHHGSCASEPGRAEIRVAYLVTHPIQYQAPLLKRIAQEPDIRVKTFFASDVSVGTFRDSGFSSTIRWDVPLLEGYDYEFLPALGDVNRVSILRPFSRGLGKRLRAGNFNALWVHGYARPQHWLAMLAAKRLGMKVLLRDEATSLGTKRGFAKRFAKHAFFAWLGRVVDAFLTIGTLNRNYYRQNGIAEERLFPMPYAVDNGLFRSRAKEAAAHREELRKSLQLETGRPIMLFAGKLIERKRPGDLLEAYSRMGGNWAATPPYLLYIGEGQLRAQLEARAAALGLRSVKFLGFKNQSQLPAFYDLCDVFVMPSVYEPWGLVVNEVMNAGRAVVISNEVGCSADLVENGVNGLVFRARDVVDLSRALSEILVDPLRLAHMGTKSLERINQWSFDEDIEGLRAALISVQMRADFNS